MLSGGYLRGSSLLLTGLPGTAKSTLAGAFVRSSCQRGERALYVTFDAHPSETIRNLTSVGIHVAPYVASGRLAFHNAIALDASAEIQLMRIRAAARAHRSSSIVIDPVTAIAKSSDSATAIGVFARFIHWAKAHRLTLVCTSLLSGSDPHAEATELGASTLCDAWIHLAYAQHGGERNRSLTIIKARGTSHSNQVRELILSDAGITLADVYQVGGDVLMGTMRWERESQQREKERAQQDDARRKRLDLERERAELEARVAITAKELDLNEAALAEVTRQETDRLTREAERLASLRRRRGADAEPARRRRAPARRKA
jgi:circadian clock protein KaiC